MCPGAPFLVRGTADAVAARLDAVVAACSAAVSRLTGADALLLITSAAGTGGGHDHPIWRELAPGTIISTTPVRRSDLPGGLTVALSSRGYSRPANPSGVTAIAAPSVVERPVTDPPVVSSAAVGTAVGATLLAESLTGAASNGQAPQQLSSHRPPSPAQCPPTTAIEINGDPAEVAEMLAGRAQSAERLALLVIADGSACHGDDAPGRRDDRAAAFDAALAEALAAGNPAALRTAAADRALGRALLASVDPLAVLALLTDQRPPTSADLLYAGAPLGVGYLVASWRWETGDGARRWPRDRADRRRRRASVPGSRRLIVVAGPTGTGKSELGLDLAERLDGEIVNADSMQLYRGMDIGTAKLPVHERRGIPHHLLDVLDVSEIATVASYQRDARASIEDILARGRTPVLVGGSGLYIQSVVDDIDFPATDPTVRARLQGDLDRLGIDYMFGLLDEQDPAAALAIGPANGRKIVRALEVIAITGRPFTATMPRRGRPRYGAVLLRLDRPTDQLDQRLEDRVRAMVAAGFLDEVRRLDAAGLRRGVTASRALGYAQLLAVLDGETDLEQAIMATAATTRRFVRRQRSWFRRDERMIDLDATEPDLVERALAAVVDSTGTLGGQRLGRQWPGWQRPERHRFEWPDPDSIGAAVTDSAVTV